MGSNVGRPQINVHFYVMASMNREQMPAEQIWQNWQFGKKQEKKHQTLMVVEDLKKKMSFKESKANLDFLNAYKSELKGKRKRIYVLLCRSLPERWLAREATFYTDAQRPICLFVQQHERLD